LIFGAVPASARSLRPASLAMIDFRASRSSSALSVNPVYSCALFSRSSSSVTDALVALPLYTNTSTAMRFILVFQGLAIQAVVLRSRAGGFALGSLPVWTE
jgi:hypothetical protein